jgi:hypothetical protein
LSHISAVPFLIILNPTQAGTLLDSIRKLMVRILAGIQTLLIKVLTGFLQCPYENAGILFGNSLRPLLTK